MECPFCIETLKDEATVCRSCTRDLTLVRPVIFEIYALIGEIAELQRELTRAKMRLALIEAPARFLSAQVGMFVVLPSILLVAAHYLVTFQFDVTPVFLRIASVLIPLPFGFALATRKGFGFWAAIAFGVATAALGVGCMLLVTGYLDTVPVVPSTRREWRETLEYGTSIALAFGAGNILATLLFGFLPGAFRSDGKPSAAVYWAASFLGEQVSKQAVRRRARRIQDVLRTVGPLIGFIVTVSGSVYAGLKSLLAQ
jgi:hypothetical protein